ncbi:MAG: glycine betaine ABC transporter substrate-binding protein [Actinomycetes bacterium]
MSTRFAALGSALALALLATGCSSDSSQTSSTGSAGAGGDSSSAAAPSGSAAASGGSSDASLKGAKFTVGSKDFTESILLSKMVEDLLKQAGADVEDKTNIKGSVNTRDAMLSGNIDMYWDYTGTGWLVYLKHDKPIADAAQQYQSVKDEDLSKNGVVWLDATPMSDTYAFAMTQADAQKYGVTNDSDIATKVPADQQIFCLESEFSTRPDGWPGFKSAYGLSGAKTKLLDTGLIYTTVAKGGTCTFGEVFSTDGRIPGLKLQVVKDDKHFFPNYNAALTLKKDVLDKYPAIADVVNPLAAKITDEVMAQLNAQVDVQGDDADTVAEQFLKDQGLLK